MLVQMLMTLFYVEARLSFLYNESEVAVIPQNLRHKYIFMILIFPFGAPV